MKLYNGMGITTYAKQLMAREVKEKIEDMGIEIYDPSSQPFNDKKSVGGDDIALLIVDKDSEAIYNSNVRFMNTQEDNLGTCIETGMIKGYTDHANVILSIIREMKEEGYDDSEILRTIGVACATEVKKEFIPYHTDIRVHDEPEIGFKRSVGFHQFLRGVNLSMLEGTGNNDGYYTYDQAFDMLWHIKDCEALVPFDKNPVYVSSKDGNLSVEINYELVDKYGSMEECE